MIKMNRKRVFALLQKLEDLPHVRVTKRRYAIRVQSSLKQFPEYVLRWHGASYYVYILHKRGISHAFTIYRVHEAFDLIRQYQSAWRIRAGRRT